MKKFILATAFCLVSLIACSQNFSVAYEHIACFTIVGDTMEIDAADKVIAGSIYVPSFSTDSVTVSGYSVTIDGITSNGVKIPPGEATINFGFKLAVTGKLTIEAPGTCWLVLLVDD